jgi:16S rRNA (guanine(966)-N(2))-methyltransferase RsmD
LLRVVSGTAKGRKLISPPDDGRIRPTTDRVKEAIFDIIQFDVEGRKVLDLFAGSGQLGIEALSRGAKIVAFVDENSDAIKLIRQNVEKCASVFSELQYYIYQSDAVSFLKRKEKYDIIILDPPYMTNLMKKALDAIITVDKLEFGGIIICESPKPLEELDGYFRKVYKYGKTYVTVFKSEEQSA